LEASIGIGQAGGATDETSDFRQGVNEAAAEFRRRKLLGLIGRLTFGMGELREQDGLLPGSVISGFAFGLERCQLIAAVVVMLDVNPIRRRGFPGDFRMVSTCTTEPVT
jgi:hypothetical protein